MRPRGILVRPGWQNAALKLARPFCVVGNGILQGAHETVRSKVKEDGAENQLRRYEQRVYSQQGEDGILRELFYRIGTDGKYFVEFGVEDGSVCNTALLAHDYGWSGLYIEADEQAAKRLRVRWQINEGICVRHSFVTAQNISETFREMRVPPEFDLLSIDIDGNDYWVWKSLVNYRPRIVVIEYNAAYPPPHRWIMAYDPMHSWDGTTHFGASLAALHSLGERLGYALVGTESRGLNAFFIRKDLLCRSGLKEATAAIAYHPPRYGALRVRFPYRDGPFVTDE